MTEREADAIIKKCWANLGQGLVEFAKTPEITPETFESYVEVRGIEHLKASHAKGKGLVLLASHFGSYEFSGQFLAFSGMKTAIIARRIKNPLVNDFVTRMRTSHGVGIILARWPSTATGYAPEGYLYGLGALWCVQAAGLAWLWSGRRLLDQAGFRQGNL